MRLIYSTIHTTLHLVKLNPHSAKHFSGTLRDLQVSYERQPTTEGLRGLQRGWGLAHSAPYACEREGYLKQIISPIFETGVSHLIRGGKLTVEIIFWNF